MALTESENRVTVSLSIKLLGLNKAGGGVIVTSSIEEALIEIERLLRLHPYGKSDQRIDVEVVMA